MGLFDIFKRKNREPQDERLFGKWQLLRTEQDFHRGDCVISEFTSDGRLIYSITESGLTHIMNMVYRVEGGVLVTDQPSHPREDRTKYSFDEHGSLVLDYRGAKTWFKRIL